MILLGQRKWYITIIFSLLGGANAWNNDKKMREIF